MCERLYALSYALRACMAIIWIARAVYIFWPQRSAPPRDTHMNFCTPQLGLEAFCIGRPPCTAPGPWKIRATALGFGPSGADQRRIDPGPSGGTPRRPVPRAAAPRAPRRAPLPIGDPRPTPRAARHTPRAVSRCQYGPIRRARPMPPRPPPGLSPPRTGRARRTAHSRGSGSPQEGLGGIEIAPGNSSTVAAGVTRGAFYAYT